MKNNYSYEMVNEESSSNLVILCDHACNYIHDKIAKNNLHLSSKDLNRHIAFDVGTLEIGKTICKELEAILIYTKFSRLLIDPNRNPEDPTSIMRYYDKTIIKGNNNLSEEERAFRKKTLYLPYHKKISEILKDKVNKGLNPKIISIHSFSKQLKGNILRPWDISILWNDKNTFSTNIYKSLKKNKKLTIGANEPYDGKLPGSTIDKHCKKNKFDHVILEFRNDHLENKFLVKKWAKLISKIIKENEKIE